MLLDPDNQNEKIYANFHEHEFSEVPLLQAQWGNYSSKPQIQSNWDKNIVKAIAAIVDEGVMSASTANNDLRPKLVDVTTGRAILVDSGASRSIWPVADYPGRSPDPFTSLKAVNGSTIGTFGVETIKVQVSGSFTFQHQFILAPRDEVVLGWDYLVKAKLDIAWRGDKRVLAKGDKVITPLKMAKVNSSILNLAPIANVGATNLTSDTDTIPTKYRKIIDQYPNLTKFHFKKAVPAHNVIHHIETDNEESCTAKLRPIMKGTEKAIKGEQSWMELVELGIV